jgi:hypothetical protein
VNEELKRGILTQQVGVHSVLVAAGDLVEALTDQFDDRVPDVPTVTAILEALLEATGQLQAFIQLAQHNQAGIAAEGAALEVEDDAGLKLEAERDRTLCGHRSSEIWVS